MTPEDTWARLNAIARRCRVPRPLRGTIAQAARRLHRLARVKGREDRRWLATLFDAG